MNPTTTIGNRILAARTAARFTQAALAEKIGSSVSQISNWERGIEPVLGTLVKIAEACKSPCLLCGRKPPRHSP